MMKKNLLFFFLVTFGLLSNIHAQRKHRINHEKFKALKTAFITDKLDLTVKEAEKFWPIYNAYHKAHKKLSYQLEHDIKKKIDDLGGIENLSKNEADKILEKIVRLKKQKSKLSEQLYPDLKKVISAKKIILLTKSERDFRHKIFREYKRQRRNHSNR